MTILIVDDHPIVRKGIHALLASAFAVVTMVLKLLRQSGA